MSGQALSRIRSFAGNAAEVGLAACRGRLVPVAWVTALSVTSAGATGLTIGLIGRSIDQLQTDAPVAVPGLGLDMPGAQFVAALAAGTFVLLGVAAVASYAARRRARAIARDFHRRIASESLDIIARSAGLRGTWAPQQLRLIPSRDAIHVSKFVETLVLMLEPLAYCVAAVALAFHFQPAGALLGVAGLCLVAPFIYLRSSEIQHKARSYFQGAAQGNVRTIAEFVREASNGVPARPGEAGVGERYLERDEVEEFYARFDDVQLASTQMLVTTSLFVAVFVALGVYALGRAVMSGSFGEGELAGFVGAFIVLVKSLQRLSGDLASLHRFYPQVVEYLAFAHLEREVVPTPVVESLEQPLRLRHADGELELVPGTAARLVTCASLDKVNVRRLVAPLAAALSPGECEPRVQFLSDQRALADTDPLDAIWHDGSGRDAALHLLGVLDVDGSARAALEQASREATCADLPPNLRRRLRAAAFLTGTACLKLLEARTVSAFAERLGEAGVAAGASLVLVVTAPREIDGGPDGPCVVVDDGRLVAAGTSRNSVAGAVRGLHAPAASGADDAALLMDA